MPPDRATGPPVFVVSAGRSGSTMLRLMLDSHPELAIPGESHFVMRLWRGRRAYGPDGSLDVDRLVHDATITHQFRAWSVSPEALRRRLDVLERPGFADVMEALYMAYADERGKARWGDKTPQYVRSIPQLASLFPGSRFIHVIRDGRDVALSYLSLDWGPSTVWQAAHRWRRDVRSGRRGARAVGADRYMEVRYESLVERPDDVLRECCAFIGIEFHPSMLEYHRDALERAEHRADRVLVHASATRPPTRGLRDWRSQMSPRDVLVFEAVAGDVLSDLGYERRHPRVPPRLRAEARLRSAALSVRERGWLGRKARARRESLRPSDVAAGSASST